MMVTTRTYIHITPIVFASMNIVYKIQHNLNTMQLRSTLYTVCLYNTLIYNLLRICCSV